jgi:hypothetical protein
MPPKNTTPPAPTTPTLEACEGAFDRAPSLTTAQAWLDRAIDAYKDGDITMPELGNIGAAVRAWARANRIPVPESD